MWRKAVGIGLVAVVAAAGCGGDDDDDAAATATDAPAVSAAAAAEGTAAASETTTAATSDAAGSTAFEPVTIEHAFGTTTLDAPPQRIATIGLQWTDVVLALGVEPIIHVAEPLAGEGGIYPWQAGMLDGSTGISLVNATDVPYEEVAALRPDLILITYLAEDQAIYDRLNSIAPTIGMLGDRQVDRWQDMIAVAGEILGVPEQAAQVTADVEALVRDTAAEYPGLAGKTFALANYVPGDSIYVVADEEDGSSVFFQDLGMQLDPEVLAAADGVSGRANFSFEQAGLLDGDLLVFFSNGEDPSSLVGYDQLDVVANGASAELDYAEVVGFNTPSPLSIPYSLEVVRPQLAAAAGGAS